MFALFLARHQPGLLHFAYGLFPDEEKAQNFSREILELAFKDINKLRCDSLFSSYLLGLVRTELKRRRIKPSKGNRTPLWVDLSKISRAQREIVFLYFQGFDLKKIAQIRCETGKVIKRRFLSGLDNIGKRISKRDDKRLDNLGEGEREVVKQQIKQWDVCSGMREKVLKTFELLKAEIDPVCKVPPLLKKFPEQPPGSLLIGAAVILAVTIASFFLFKAYAKDEVEIREVRESPAGGIEVLKQDV